jgi:hypothetical protein
MKKLVPLFLVITTMFGLIGIASVAHPASDVAAVNLVEDFCSDTNSEPELCKTKQADAESGVLGENGIATKIVQTIVFVTAAISVLVIMIGGFRYIISAGDSSGIEGAKNSIIYALVGLVVAVLAQVIVSFVLVNFGN